MNQARQYSQKPGAIRERTRMTDIETKWRKDRKSLPVGLLPSSAYALCFKFSVPEYFDLTNGVVLPSICLRTKMVACVLSTY